MATRLVSVRPGINEYAITGINSHITSVRPVWNFVNTKNSVVKVVTSAEMEEPALLETEVRIAVIIKQNQHPSRNSAQYQKDT